MLENSYIISSIIAVFLGALVSLPKVLRIIKKFQDNSRGDGEDEDAQPPKEVPPWAVEISKPDNEEIISKVFILLGALFSGRITGFFSIYNRIQK